MKLWLGLAVSLAQVAWADPMVLRGGEAAPQDLRLKGCSITREAVRRGRVLELELTGKGRQTIWAGLVGAAEPHLVFAWFPRGQPAKARCVDAGLVDPWAVELSLVPNIPVLRSVQTRPGECMSLTHTIVLAWTNGARDFELVSSRTSVSEVVPSTPSEDARLARAEELLSTGEVHDAERLVLGLVGERPWDPDARSLLSQTWRKLH